MSPLYGIMASQVTGHLVTSSFESIATVTVGSGGSSTITFSSIPSTYKHLQVRGIVKMTATGYPQIRFNSDSGSNYASHILYGNGASAAATAESSYTYIDWAAGNGSTAQFAAFVIDILDYTSTSKAKTLRALSGADENGAGSIYFSSGLWFATPAAISTIVFNTSANNFAQYSSFALYGVK